MSDWMSKYTNPLSIYTDDAPNSSHIDAPPLKRDCIKACESNEVSCPNKECRHWMNHEEDLNCVLVAVEKNEAGMTLREIGERLNLSFVRVCQIEKGVLNKLNKKIQKPVSIK